MTASVRARTLSLGLLLLVSANCGEFTGPHPAGDPAAISAVGGLGQTVPAGLAAPVSLSALVTDAAGTPVPDVPVRFTLTDGPSSVVLRTVNTGADGIARLDDWAPPPAPGLHSVQARTGNLFCMFGLTVVKGPPATILALTGDGTKQQADAEVAASVVVRDLGGNPLAGIPVTFTVGASGGAVTDGVQTTNAAGIARIAHWRLGSSLGTYTIDAVSGALKGTLTATVVSGPPVAMARSTGDDQRVTAGGRLRQPPTVIVTDAGGRGVPLVPVTWSMTYGGATVRSCGPIATNDAGVADCGPVTWTLTQPGTYAITASTEALTTTFIETALAVPASVTFVNAPSAEVHTGTYVPTDLTVQVLLPDGTPAAGYPVNFIPSSDGAVSDTVSVTDASGMAHTRWRVTNYPGITTLTASLDGVIKSATTLPAFGPLSFVSLSAGTKHTCTISSSAVPFCWGSNASGQVGDGQGEARRVAPVALQFPRKGGPYTTSAGDHSCLFDEQTLNAYTKIADRYCWGRSPDGTQIIPVPTMVGGTYEKATFNVASIGLRVDGVAHSCVLTTDGNPWCGGRNDAGQLGDGTTTDRSVAVQLQGGLTFRSLVVGGAHTCGITTAGASYCWGRNEAGQLGDGTTTSRSVPTPVAGGLAFVGLTAGDAHTCGVVASGEAYCWGANDAGQLGVGALIASASTPQPVSGGHLFALIAAGARHTCASVVGAISVAYCWGSNDEGQLGDGTTVDRAGPVPVADYHP